MSALALSRFDKNGGQENEKTFPSLFFTDTSNFLLKFPSHSSSLH